MVSKMSFKNAVCISKNVIFKCVARVSRAKQLTPSMGIFIFSNLLATSTDS
jgi:hypothetical protein